MRMGTSGAEFWSALAQATDPIAYKPARRPSIVVSRLEQHGTPYYILKQPEHRNYQRLSEEDYALWWQMDGSRCVKDLLFYNLRRYRSLPIGRLMRLLQELRQGHFLQDTPTNLYAQIESQLAARNPAGRGRRLINAFLHSEVAISGLDDLFAALHRRVRGLFTFRGQLLMLIFILLGSYLFARLVWVHAFALSQHGLFSAISLVFANLLVIGFHEAGHGVATKQFRRELHRGGFLLYWGLPAFFVDTRDMWLAPRWQRVAVSWAGPHTGLLLGSAAGFVLTFIGFYYPSAGEAFWVSFVYQVGFLAFLSVIVNLNPLLELDGYFMLMDGLELPNLRARAFDFWRKEVPAKLHALWREKQWPFAKRPFSLWHTLSWQQRFFALYGLLALLYTAYALWLALYFWQTRLTPFVVELWQNYGLTGQVVVLLATAVLPIPALYYLLNYGWSRVQSGLEWLARRDLLARPEVLALLVGSSLLLGGPALLFALQNLPGADLARALIYWGLHLATLLALVAVARQLAGSRFQWAIWSLAAAPVGLVLVWLAPSPWVRDGGLLLAATAVFACGMVAGFTVWPRQLTWVDRLFMAGFFLLGLLYTLLTYSLSNGRWPGASLILLGIFPGLIYLTPLLLNFARSRFALPWLLLVLAILSTPWLRYYPALHLPVILLWLYAALLYLLVGSLARFMRHEVSPDEIGLFKERARLVNAFNHFMQAMFRSYEAVFGGRRLGDIQLQMIALGPIDPDATILELSVKIQRALLLAVDRLDDLAGERFTRQAGQAAYDSLPWLEAETLARHVLAELEWGAQLAAGFILARNRRALLIRQAELFAGLDHQGIESVLQVAESWRCRKGALIARPQGKAERFFLVESGEVAVYRDGVQTAVIGPGGYFGIMALLPEGTYGAMYRALSPLQALVIRRERFDPLLRADTLLAHQVREGARHRHLLQRMPLFSGLSPQQLSTVDARLQPRTVRAGEVIVQEGQPRSHLFIIAQGMVEVTTSGAEGVVGELGPGEHFGEYALFADKPYQATYRAVQDAELLLLDKAKFDALVAGCEQMSHYVEQIGSGRLFVVRRRLGPSAILS